MLAQTPESYDLLQRINPELLGTVLIVGTVGIFIISIVTVVSVSRTWNNIASTRANHRFIRELMTQGHSIEDIERLVYGGPSIGRQVRGFVQSAKSRIAKLSRQHRDNRPVPPVKQTA